MAIAAGDLVPCPILGPVLGGWLTENYSWRYVFYINLPVGALAFLGLTAFLPGSPRNTNAKLDWFGFAVLSIVIGAVQILLDRGEQQDWFGSAEIWIEAIVAASALYVFLVHTFTTDEPLSGRLCSVTATSPPVYCSLPSSASPITPHWHCSLPTCRTS
jgi:MFS transporter, DHA2 family, multidrug resistance protein